MVCNPKTAQCYFDLHKPGEGDVFALHLEFMGLGFRV